MTTTDATDAIDITTDDISRVDTDPRKFALTDWIAGAARVTRSVDVCGRPDLMGAIEEMKSELERMDATEPDERDTRPHVKSSAAPSRREQIAHALEDARREMLESIVVWKFGTPTLRRDGKLVSGDDALRVIKEETTEDIPEDNTISEFDYRVWASQVITIAGAKVDVEWEQLRELHDRLGSYFVQTIGRTANAAVRAEGVDVPFSLKSSAIIARSSRS